MLRFADCLMVEACHAGHYQAGTRISVLAAQAIPTAQTHPRTRAAIVASGVLTKPAAGRWRPLYNEPAGVPADFVCACTDAR